MIKIGYNSKFILILLQILSAVKLIKIGHAFFVIDA